jgi:hypothetical protein
METILDKWTNLDLLLGIDELEDQINLANYFEEACQLLSIHDAGDVMFNTSLTKEGAFMDVLNQSNNIDYQ